MTAPEHATFCAIYRGVVVDNADPDNHKRLRLLVPSVTGTTVLDWASACLPPGGTVPVIGAQVWVMFEGGDPEYPVWVGVAA